MAPRIGPASIFCSRRVGGHLPHEPLGDNVVAPPLSCMLSALRFGPAYAPWPDDPSQGVGAPARDRSILPSKSPTFDTPHRPPRLVHWECPHAASGSSADHFSAARLSEAQNLPFCAIPLAGSARSCDLEAIRMSSRGTRCTSTLLKQRGKSQHRLACESQNHDHSAMPHPSARAGLSAERMPAISSPSLPSLWRPPCR